MKQLLTIVFAFTLLGMHAQTDQKTETKKEREQRYIDEVNPFRELGYKPKISTLSKGKYREAFPDTIVQIGSFTYNRQTKQVTGVKVTENLGLSEADLKPEIVSRWMNPDPLSDEFPDKSPYNFVNNNPLRFVDPLGLAPEDLILKGKAEHQQQFVSTINSELGGDYASVDANGKVSLNISDEQFGNLSEGQQAFYNTINEPVSADGDTTINVVSNNVDIRFGGADSGKIDIADINNIDNGGEAFTKSSVLGHEVKEQFEIQSGTDGKPVNKYEAHNRAEGTEASITGFTRTNTSRGGLTQGTIPKNRKRGLSGSRIHNPYKKALSGTTTFTYQKGNRTVNATVTYRYGNVIKVTEK